MTEQESEENKELEYLSLFYPAREVPQYDMIDDGELLRLAFDLKEKRLRSVEGLLFLSNQNKKQYSDDLLSGENESYKKERSKYVQYLAQKHQKSLPTELKREKIVRVIKRTKTLRSKKEEKKERIREEKEDDKEDLNAGEENSQVSERVEEDFEDEENIDGDYDRFEDNEQGSYGGGDGDGGDYE